MNAITCTSIMDMHKKHNFFVTVHTSVGLVKPAQSAGRIFQIPTFQTGKLCERHRHSNQFTGKFYY